MIGKTDYPALDEAEELAVRIARMGDELVEEATIPYDELGETAAAEVTFDLVNALFASHRWANSLPTVDTVFSTFGIRAEVPRSTAASTFAVLSRMIASAVDEAFPRASEQGVVWFAPPSTFNNSAGRNGRRIGVEIRIGVEDGE